MLTTDEAVLEVASIGPMTSFTLQVDTPDAVSLGAAEAAIRAVPGVRSASTTSLALGGVSVMRVAFDGDAGALRTALAARGWRVEDAGGILRIRRGAAPAPAPAAAPPEAQPPR
jgi:hypothetical protein